MVVDSEPDLADADEFMRQMEADRERDRERATFEWCQTIREAGERYRECNDVEAVANDIGRDVDRVEEALTVYRLIFEESPDHMATKTVEPARVFFALDQDHTDADIAEDQIREFVGSWHREYDVDSEAVGEPPEATIPPHPLEGVDLDFSITLPISEELIQATLPPAELFAAFAETPNIYSHSALGQMVDPLNEAFSTAVADLARDIYIPSSAFSELQELQIVLDTALSTTIADLVTAVDIPQTVAADVATLHAATFPNIPTVSAQSTVGVDPVQEVSTGTTTTNATPKTETGETPPSQSPPTATVDSTLPDADALTADLVFELPTLFVESILSAGHTRVWFSQMDTEDQTAAVAILLGLTAYALTLNPASVPLAMGIAPAVRKRIVVDLD